MNKALFFVALFALFWALDILLGKWVFLQGGDPWTWMFYTYIFAVPLWGGFMIIKKRIQPKHIVWQARGSLAVVALTAAAGTMISYVGLSMTAAINYSFLAQTSALFTILLAHLWFVDEQLSWIKSTLMLCFLVGVYFVATQGALIVPQIGDLLVILGAFFFAINNITIKVCLQKKLTVPTIVLARHLTTLIVAGVGALYIGAGSLDISLLPYALLSACFVCLWLNALNKVVEYASPSYMTMMAMINPLVVILGAVLLFNESISLIQILGGILIIGSGIVLEWRRNNGVKSITV